MTIIYIINYRRKLGGRMYHHDFNQGLFIQT